MTGMRARLLVAGLIAAGAATLPVAPAAAYCDPVLSAAFGRCTNSCVETQRAIQSADEKVLGDRISPSPCFH